MDLNNVFNHYQQFLLNSIQLYFSKNGQGIPAVEMPELESELFNGRQLNHHETIIVLTALAPHVQPAIFDQSIQQFLPAGGDFAEFGGVKGTNTRYMLPTGDTVLFLLAGADVNKRKQVLHYFDPGHWFRSQNVLSLEPVKDGEPRMSGKIILSNECVDLLTTGIIGKPTFGPDFPARLVTTQMEWADLIIADQTAKQIGDIQTWLHCNQTFIADWQMGKRIKPGYRALFYGPSGTGKTLAATLLGKQFGQEVYRIDLSQVVSKYIGETEKNLEKIFEKAEHKNWILFFDEADALFGKRSSVQNAHDKYANQEVSYLLQRVEDFPGLIILASNFKSNIDQAFTRRFNAVVKFAMPSQAERLALWKSAMPAKAVLAADVDLELISLRYEMSGSSIVSVIHYASLQAINRQSTTIGLKDILEGIRREFEKEERVFR